MNDNVLYMETYNIHPITQIMADLMMETFNSSEESETLPRELFVFHLATFLTLYETTSLVLATSTIMQDCYNAREFLDTVMGRDVNTLSDDERVRSVAEASAVVSNTLIIDKVLELVSPFISE